MKKLLSLLMCVGIVLSLAVSASANEPLVWTEAKDGVTMTVTFDGVDQFTTTVTGATGEVALLVIDGDETIKADSNTIQAINQDEAGTTFSYKLKGPNAIVGGQEFTFKVGSSDPKLTSAISKTIVPITAAPQDAYKLTGKVTNAAAYVSDSVADVDFEAWLEEYIDDNEYNSRKAYIDSQRLTKVNIIKAETLKYIAFNTINFVYFDVDYLLDESVPVAIGTGDFEIDLPVDMVPGDYFVVYERPGFITCFNKFTFDNDDVDDVIDVALIAGDINATLSANMTDATTILSNSATYYDGTGGFKFLHDITLDLKVNMSDATGALSSTGIVYSHYEVGKQNVDFDALSAEAEEEL